MDKEYKRYGAPDEGLIEEIGELLQAIGKAKRFGYFNFHPETKVPNLVALEDEISDVRCALDRMENYLRILHDERIAVRGR